MCCAKIVAKLWSKMFCSRLAVIKFLTLTVCLAQSGESDSQAFLKPGASYKGKTAATRITNAATGVAVLVAIDNWTRYTLVEPATEITCGHLMEDLPTQVEPGTSEMALVEKGPGFTGVCAVLTYRMELDPEEEESPHYVQVMMSVPYNLNSYSSYLAVGIADSYFNSTGLFDQLYYYNGPFERAKAGNLVEYTSESNKVKLRGTMQPDTYKPILRVSVLPVEKSVDGFHLYSGKAKVKVTFSLTFASWILVYHWTRIIF